MRKGIDQNGKVDPVTKKVGAPKSLPKAQYSSTSMHEYGDDQVRINEDRNTFTPTRRCVTRFGPANELSDDLKEANDSTFAS